jgi:uncharacterized protein YndB with AHSA1/START domain
MPASIGTDPIVKEVRVQASPETVWGFFTEPEKMTRWLCTAATVDPRPGGVNNMTHRSDDGVDHHLESRFVEVEPPHRLLFTWKFTTGTPEERAVKSTVEVTFEADGDGTLVRLVHRDVPEGLWDDHRGGWTTLFGRLEKLFV